MTTPSVSIIIPFCNAEATLERAMASVAVQTHGDIQMVLVNDGSTDNSEEVIKRFVALHEDYLHSPLLINLAGHHGVAAARAAGLENATGEYIIQCDADGYLHPSYIQQLYDTAKMQDADIVISPVKEQRSHRVTTQPLQFTVDATLNDMPIDKVTFTLCNKLIRRDFITTHNIGLFSGIDHWDDLGFITQIYALRPKMALCTLPGYNFVKPSGRACQTKADIELIERDHLLMALMLEQWMVEHELNDEYALYLDYLKYVAKINLLTDRPRDVERWKSTFPEVNGRIMSLTYVGLLTRLFTRLVAMLPTSITRPIASIADTIDSLLHIKES